MTEEHSSSAKSNGSAEELHSSASSTTEQTLTEVINIEDTPFTAVRVADKYFLALGKYRLTELLNTYGEIQEEINNISWNRLTQVIAIICDEQIARAKDKPLTETSDKEN